MKSTQASDRERETRFHNGWLISRGTATHAKGAALPLSALPQAVMRADDVAFQPDAALFKVISQHGFRPPVWEVTAEEGAALGERLAKMFPVCQAECCVSASSSLRPMPMRASTRHCFARSSRAAEVTLRWLHGHLRTHYGIENFKVVAMPTAPQAIFPAGFPPNEFYQCRGRARLTRRNA